MLNCAARQTMYNSRQMCAFAGASVSTIIRLVLLLEFPDDGGIEVLRNVEILFRTDAADRPRRVLSLITCISSVFIYVLHWLFICRYSEFVKNC
jgi:hypothetical protein